MSVLDRLKAVFSSKEEQRHRYQCIDCQTTFESSESRMAKVTCQMCGSSSVQSVA